MDFEGKHVRADHGVHDGEDDVEARESLGVVDRHCQRVLLEVLLEIEASDQLAVKVGSDTALVQNADVQHLVVVEVGNLERLSDVGRDVLTRADLRRLHRLELAAAVRDRRPVGGRRAHLGDHPLAVLDLEGQIRRERRRHAHRLLARRDGLHLKDGGAHIHREHVSRSHVPAISVGIGRVERVDVVVETLVQEID